MLFVLALGLFPAAAAVPDASYRLDPPGFSGDSADLVMRVAIPDDWYIQSNAPLDGFLIPTTVRAKGEGLVFGDPVFPPHVEKDIEILGGKVALFQGDIEIRLPIRRKNARVSEDALAQSDVFLRYQACDSSQCLAPREVRAVYREEDSVQ